MSDNASNTLKDLGISLKQCFNQFLMEDIRGYLEKLNNSTSYQNYYNVNKVEEVTNSWDDFTDSN
jgi:hypothetical protein